jgi:hypothetical protein
MWHVAWNAHALFTAADHFKGSAKANEQDNTSKEQATLLHMSVGTLRPAQTAGAAGRSQCTDTCKIQ